MRACRPDPVAAINTVFLTSSSVHRPSPIPSLIRYHIRLLCMDLISLSDHGSCTESDGRRGRPRASPLLRTLGAVRRLLRLPHLGASDVDGGRVARHCERHVGHFSPRLRGPGAFSQDPLQDPFYARPRAGDSQAGRASGTSSTGFRGRRPALAITSTIPEREAQHDKVFV